MNLHSNPYRGQPDVLSGLEHTSFPSVNADAPSRLLLRCPRAARTPLVSRRDLADHCHVGEVLIKDERDRMGLGSFKALGAAYVIACDAEAGRAKGATYVAASAGNHGLSVAAGATAFGARSVIYLSHTVPEGFADRLRAEGAEVVRDGDIYEDSMTAAATAAETQGWHLLSDSSWPGYMDRPHRLMEGYLVLMEEAVEEIDPAPTHIFLQAGVGGLAAAAAALARKRWGVGPHITVVEPDAAPALQASIAAGHAVTTSGPVSIMGRLDCKEPSLIALRGLARDADTFVTISEAEAQDGADLCDAAALPSTPSGAAGLAALAAADPVREALGLTETSRVLLILSEGPG